ncbi:MULTISPECIES: DMT family transporter [unclassified Nocardia]|uniref:DMT family transporter n=1 Tax=unclassified Nocardia TaxID=2637762 RepID=UPI001CE3EA0F|nr:MULTISPECIES: DMT family transporter [unclassified Nocardia]
MTANPPAAIGCALIAALLFALAAVAQQTAAAAVPEDKPLVGALLRNPRWWAGIIGDIGGYGMQVVALALGAVLLVQPILVSALVFALPLAARLNGRRITARTWATAVALAAALACFLIIGDPSEGKTTAPLSAWMLPLGILVGLVTAAAVFGLSGGDPNRRALLLGAASGSLYGLAAALTEYVAGLFEHGVIHVLGSWQTWALIVAGITGFFLQQKGFQAGPLAASLPAVTIAEPLAAAYIGITVLDERFQTNSLGLVGTAVAVIVMCAATIRLSRAQAAA